MLEELIQQLQAEIARITLESTERYNALVAAQSDLNNASATIASLQNQLANVPTGGTQTSDLAPLLAQVTTERDAAQARVYELESQIATLNANIDAAQGQS